MNTKIWLEGLSFGSNFGNLCAFGSNPVWCYFLVRTFKIKKFESISSNGFRDIAKSLKISFGSSFVSLRAFGSFGSFDSHYTPFKQKKPHSIISTLSWILVYITSAHGRTDGRTDRQTFFEKVFFFLLFFFFLPDQEYIYLSISISIIFQISPPFWRKLVYLFSILEIGMKMKIKNFKFKYETKN